MISESQTKVIITFLSVVDKDLCKLELGGTTKIPGGLAFCPMHYVPTQSGIFTSSLDSRLFPLAYLDGRVDSKDLNIHCFVVIKNKDRQGSSTSPCSFNEMAAGHSHASSNTDFSDFKS